MTGDKSQFISLKAKDEGVVIFGDNNKYKIIDLDNIKITPTTYIKNIFFVDGLMYNLLRINQLYDKKLIIYLNHCIVL